MSQSINTRPAGIDRDEDRRSLVSVDPVDANHAAEKAVIGVLVAYGDNFARTGLRALLKTERDIAVLGWAGDGDRTLARVLR